MRLLILGGTLFLGREVAELAVGKGWDVVTFNRGLSGPDRPGVVAVRGDRSIAKDVAQVLDIGPFDALVDCSGYVPRNVLDIARSLRPHVGRYVFVSSVSAYSGWENGWTAGGLVGLLVLIAGLALLFTGSYPKPLYDLVLGLDRWVLRVTAYTALMTDHYPPFRLDQGGTDPGSQLREPASPTPSGEAATPPAATPAPAR